MLEAKNFDVVDNISPLICFPANRLCGEEDMAQTAKVLIGYVEILHCVYQRHRRVGWKNESLDQLSMIVETIKRLGAEAL